MLALFSSQNKRAAFNYSMHSAFDNNLINNRLSLKVIRKKTRFYSWNSLLHTENTKFGSAHAILAHYFPP